MPATEHCPECGTEIGVDAPGGLCPRCLAYIAVTETGVEDGDGAALVEPRPAVTREIIIGDYQLLEVIGRGGMGIVYRARQLSLDRDVALKLISPGLDSGQIIARFDAERQTLARMNHPNIARVFDAGAGPATRPYFVMELVQGIAITRYCDEQRLPIRERLNLFQSVCSAIQHAHQNGIIHRDIKPGNVLVAVQDGKPVPKVIDFGVVKAIDPRLTAGFATEMGALVGTPDYMSPEQAGPNPEAIDTRSDVYGLGVLLYELLTGTTPINRRTPKIAAFDDIRRIIQEQEAPPPDTRLTETTLAPEDLFAISARRRTEPSRLRRLLVGDLDWIVMKALKKEPDHRYSTVAALTEDIQRYLNTEPLLCRPANRLYSLRKLIRRNPAVAALVGGIAVSVCLGYLGILRQLTKTERALHQTEDMAKLLKEMARGLSPNVDSARRLEILDATTWRATSALQDRPDLQIDWWSELGSVYLGLEEYSKAGAALGQALKLLQSKPRQPDADLGDLVHNYGYALFRQKRYREAELQLSNAAAIFRQSVGENHPLVAKALDNMGGAILMQSRFSDAETAFSNALAIHVQAHSNNWQTFNTQCLLGQALRAQGKYALAEPYLTNAYYGLLRKANEIPNHHRANLKVAGREIVRLYTEWPKAPQSNEWRRKLEESAPQPRAEPPSRDPK